MNQHQKIEELLSIYDELAPNELQTVNRHLETCDACRATVDAYRKMDASISAYTAELVNQASMLEIPGPIPDLCKRSISWPPSNFWDGLIPSPAAVGRLAIAGVFSLLLLLLAVGNSFFPNETSVLTAATSTPTADVSIVPTSTVEPANVESDKAIVRFGLYGGDSAQEYLRLARAFEEQNQDIDVQFTFFEHGPISPQSNIETAQQEAFSQTVSEVDAMVTNDWHQHLGTESLHDLSSWMDQDLAFADDQFASGSMQMVRSDNRTWAIPLKADVELIYYDQDAFDKAGLAYPAYDWSWEEFVAAAQQLTLKQEGGKIRWGYVDPWHQYHALINSQLSHLSGEQLYAANRQQVHDVIEEYVGLYLDSKSSPNYGSQAWRMWVDGGEYVDDDLIFITSDVMNAGTTAMWRDLAGNWRWHLNTSHVGKLERIGVVPVPRNKATNQTSRLFMFSSLVMSKQTEVPQETWRWLAYVSQNHSIYETQGYQAMPMRLNVNDIDGNQTNADLEEARNYAFSHSYIINKSPYTLPDLIQKILEGEQNVEQAVDQLVHIE